jgi:ubiquinone/menaquinone biosynthesis C-methylase UbiE
MDYDSTSIPERYDRARSYGPGVLEQWLRLIAENVDGSPVRRIMDLGCGTGRYTEALASHFDADVIGVDPSQKMLAEAIKKSASPRVRYERAVGEALPVAAGSMDLVFISMVFHHFTSTFGVAAECRRILRDGGTVFVRSASAEQIQNYPYVPFFPASEAHMRERLPRKVDVNTAFESAGFVTVFEGLVNQQVAESWSEYAGRISLRADSMLVGLSDAEFAAGLTRLSRYAERADAAQAVHEPIDFFVFR